MEVWRNMSRMRPRILSSLRFAIGCDLNRAGGAARCVFSRHKWDWSMFGPLPEGAVRRFVPPRPNKPDEELAKVRIKNRTKKPPGTPKIHGNAVKVSKRGWLLKRTQEEVDGIAARKRLRIRRRQMRIHERRVTEKKKVLNKQIATAANPYRVYEELQRLRLSGKELSEEYFEAIERWFKSDTAASVGLVKRPREEEMTAALKRNNVWHGLGWIGRGRWDVQAAEIDDEGVCQICRKKLATYELTKHETEKLATRAAYLGEKSLHGFHFRTFMNWVASHRPDVILDARSLRICSTETHNKRARSRTFHEILQWAVEELRMLSVPFLVILDSESAYANGNSFVRSCAPGTNPRHYLYDLKESKEAFTTLKGVDSSWLCFAAAVKHNCFLITNDNFEKPLRIFGTKFLPKWIERHQIRFKFTPDPFLWPPSYSVAIQESPDGSWHVPSSAGERVDHSRTWLCITRASSNYKALPKVPLPSEFYKE